MLPGTIISKRTLGLLCHTRNTSTSMAPGTPTSMPSCTQYEHLDSPADPHDHSARITTTRVPSIHTITSTTSSSSSMNYLPAWTIGCCCTPTGTGPCGTPHTPDSPTETSRRVPCTCVSGMHDMFTHSSRKGQVVRKAWMDTDPTLASNAVGEVAHESISPHHRQLTRSGCLILRCRAAAPL